MHVIAAKAVSFLEALQPSFKDYQKKVKENANKLAKELEKRGLRIVSGGTDTHVFLVDLTAMKVTGKAVENGLEEVNITVNKNTIPDEKLSPFVTSGIRIGTPAITTRGMGLDEMPEIADIIVTAIKSMNEDGEIKDGEKETLLNRVKEMCKKFPLYKNKI